MWRPEVNSAFVQVIKEYCENREYKCKGCKWSAEKWEKKCGVKTNEYITCFFANCPCNWKVGDKTF